MNIIKCILKCFSIHFHSYISEFQLFQVLIDLFLFRLKFLRKHFLYFLGIRSKIIMINNLFLYFLSLRIRLNKNILNYKISLLLSLPFSSNSINEGYFTINFKIKRQDFVLRDLVKEKMLNIKICLHKI